MHEEGPLSDGRSEGFTFLVQDVGDDHVGTIVGERTAVGRADASCSSGDDRRLPLQRATSHLVRPSIGFRGPRDGWDVPVPA